LTEASRRDFIAVVSDAKPGHLNQSLGLAEALQRQRPGLSVREIPAFSRGRALSTLLAGDRRDDIALLIGAGHGTHLSLLALRRVARCPSIVLMRPSLPGILFDLRIEPRHDGGRESERCWLSDGPLNRMQPSAGVRAGGMMLIGGPSPHYAWDAASLLRQIEHLCDGSRHWQLSGSRRTPQGFLEALRDRQLPGLELHDAASLPPGWLAGQLPQMQSCWVTPDSASMVYEALTAGCAVGLFDLPAQSGSRVAGAVSALIDRNLLTPFSGFSRGSELKLPPTPFAEADRCAKRILELGWI
jgi:mitochondrial fission protein ELM1